MEVKPLHAIIFGDTHIGSFKKYNTEENSRLENSINGFEQVIKEGWRLGVRVFFFDGDLTDTPKVLEHTVALELVRMGARINTRYPEIKIYGIDGNHDHHAKNMLSKRSVSSLDILKVVMPDTLEIISDTYAKVADNIYVHGIPYYENDFEDALDLCFERAKALKVKAPESKHYLLIHQTPKMLDMDFIPSDTEPNDSRYSIFEHVYCGHIHTSMVLKNNFLVVGNNIHRDAADKGKKKGYWVTNLAKPQNGNIFRHLEGFPEFEEVTEGSETSVEGNYALEVIEKQETTEGSIVEADKFSTAVESTEILKNYWEVVDGKDEELLTVGLSCIKTVTDGE